MSNPYRLLKQFALLTGLWLAAVTAVKAQQPTYYICIQSENGQPFYTQIGDKVYSSSNIGHLIIAGLKDNVCNLEIGFPQHTSRPQQFTVPIRGKDHGFQLKKNGSQDWALVSWQGQETIKPQKGAGSSDLLYGERKKDDAFATLMAAVVNDSAVLYTSIVKNDAPAAPALATAAKAEEKTAVVQPAPDSAASITAKNESDTVATVVAVYRNDKPLFDTTTAKPANNDTIAAVAKEYKNEKPLYDTTAAVVKEYKNEKPLFDTTIIAAAKTKSDNDKNVIIDLTTGKPLYDTSIIAEEPEDAVAKKVAVKETPVEKPVIKPVKKQDRPGVVKVQQTTKDGETKLVFIDSSESPASVVTVYISEEPVQQKAPAQPVSTDLTSAAPKTQPEQKNDTEKKPEPAKKTDTVLKEEPLRKTEPAPAEPKKEVAKSAPITSLPVNTNAQLTVEVVDKPVDKPVEKPADKPVQQPAVKRGDTLVIILESPQMKRDTAKARQEAPKPLYEPRQAGQPAQNTVDQPAVDIKETEKTTGKTGRNRRANREKNADKAAENAAAPGITDKKAFAEPPAAKKETAKIESQPENPVAKQEAAPAPVKKDSVIAKQEAPKAYDPNPTELDKKKVVMINSDCARFATDTDVDKLRVKMLAEKEVAKRVAAANKVFKTMCLTAKQMKALSELFPTDETRYKFLEMAYPFAADTGNFKELYQLFGEESYQTRFKTLVKY